MIDWLDDAAHALDRRLMVRLVKGAYWDTEVKRAQERGLADYPVFTRKPMTDLSYMACMRQLLRGAAAALSAVRHPQRADGGERDRGGAAAPRATNSSACTAWARCCTRRCWPSVPGAACRVYAPVGSHRDLLAYLVRRLLENGANSSFVAVAADPSVPIEEILKRPQAWIGDAAHARHPHIPLPRDLYRPSRLNSSGVEFGDRAALGALTEVARAAHAGPGRAADRGEARVGIAAGASPIDGAVIGRSSKLTPTPRRRDALRRRASRPGPRRRSSAAPRSSNAPPNCWRRRAAG